MLLDELVAAVRAAELRQKELIVNLLRWFSALLELYQDGPEPAGEFLALPARLAGQLSHGLTDLDRGELVCRLEALRVERVAIIQQLQVDDRYIRAFRQMASEPEGVKAVIRKHDIPQSLYKLLHRVARKRSLVELLSCIGRVKTKTGRFPTTQETMAWERAAQRDIGRDAYELLLEVMARGSE